MNEFLKNFKLTHLTLLECHRSLQSAVEASDDLFVLSQLVTATQQMKGFDSNHLLHLLLKNSKQRNVDLSAIKSLPSEKVRTLSSELFHAIQISKAIQTGFIYDEKKKKYSFNANLFATYFLTRVNIVCDENEFLYAYSNKGLFKQLSAVDMGKLVRILMNEGLTNSWRSSYEKEAIEAIKRECDSFSKMDEFSDYLNLENGMYSLQTGRLEKHHSKYCSTIQIPIHFKKNANCPKFKNFIQEISCNDNELIKVIQEIMGYLLSSEIKSEKAFYFFGRGANGKSVLAKILSILVGEENVSSIPLSQFSSQFGLEGIIGKTVNIAPENEIQGALNTEAFKALVSGDSMTINLKYRPPITNYKPKCKLVFLGNELPETNDLTNGYFRRMCIIPFKRTFKESEQNKNLLDELQLELPGIFNWAIEGLVRLQNQNYIFSECSAITHELKKYRLSQNPVLHFVESVLTIDKSTLIKRSELYNYFKVWCEQNGIDHIRTRQKFYKDFMNVVDSKSLAIVEKRIQGYEYFKGVNFKSF